MLGLVNGSQGVVKKIWFTHRSNPKKELPSVVFVNFPGYTGPPSPETWEGIDPSWVPIVPVKVEWDREGTTCWHRQLPLVPAWGITIHKSQGLSLHRAVIDLGEKEFVPGLAFVAISRVRTLAGVAFKNYFPMARLLRPNVSEAMLALQDDNIRRSNLENWRIDKHDQNLDMYLEAFDEAA